MPIVVVKLVRAVIRGIPATARRSVTLTTHVFKPACHRQTRAGIAAVPAAAVAASNAVVGAAATPAGLATTVGARGPRAI